MKKFLSALLCAVMTVSAVPFYAYAYEQDEIFEEMTVNDMLVMEGQEFNIYNYKNLTLSYSVSDNKILSSDGNGGFTALKTGTSDIILTLGKNSKSFKVTVCEPESKVTSAGKPPVMGYFGSKSVFGNECVTMLTSDGDLYLVYKNESKIIAKNVREHKIAGSPLNWNKLDIISTDGKYYRWTYNTESKTASIDLLYNYIPKQVTDLYTLTNDNRVIKNSDSTVICKNAKKVSNSGFVLFADGTLKDINADLSTVADDITDLDPVSPVAVKNGGLLFRYDKSEEGSYTGKLVDSGVTGYLSSTRLYAKDDYTTKIYDNNKTVKVCDFAAKNALVTDNAVCLVDSENTVYKKSSYDSADIKKLGINFSYFYSDNDTFGYISTDSNAVMSDGTVKPYYGDIENSDFRIDENKDLFTDFGSGKEVKVMTSVEKMLVSPTDGKTAFFIRSDGSVWACDNWTWYPRKKSDSQKFYPVKCFTESPPGAVKQDGKVTAADARLALRYSAKLQTLNNAQLKAADANADGKVTATDARILLRYAAGLAILDFINSTEKSDDNAKG